MTTEDVQPERPESLGSEPKDSGFSAFHHSYHSEGFTDLSKLRDAAEFRRKDGHGSPGETVIHLHRKEGVVCNFEYDTHEFFVFGGMKQ